MVRMSNIAISSSITLRSRLIGPRRKGGINLRNNRTGGSVVEYITSRPTAVTPAGRQDRANDLVMSTTIRPMSNR